MEMIFTIISIGLTVVSMIVIYLINHNNINYAIGLGLVMINMSLQKYNAIKRGINIAKLENMKVLFESVDANFQMIMASWKDYDVQQADKYKSRWDAILSIAHTMKESELLTDEAYTMMLESNISYIDQETKIRLENMRDQ
jgi:hypothetical protein